MLPLSVVIITFNEEKNIARCLDSIQGIADDIVVVDSFSTDKTEEICKKYKVNFVQCKWQGYSLTKNFANQLAKNDWILSLDADEVLSDELKQSVLKVKKEGLLITAKFNRLTNYCGHWIKHCGWYPDVKVRMFDRRITLWEGTIHEELKFSEDISLVHLAGDCLHYSYYTIEQHYKQADKFTSIAAQDLFSQGKKASVLKLIVSPIIKFLRDYIFNLGFLDGSAGFTVCKISAYATFLKYKKLRNIYKPS